MKKVCRLALVLLLCVPFVVSLPNYALAAELGDLDGNGTVSVADARIVLQIAAGHIIPNSTEKNLADINKDGVISLADARQVLIMAAGIDSDEGYVRSLIQKGFPRSYTDGLLALHKKYPQWEFEPFITNLDWQAAVNGERTPHNKQLIQRSVASDSYKCSCSSCNGVIQEAGGWVSASETAVKFYMDPRNFLNEEYIFQFENNIYDENRSIAVVESIIKNTWMYNSNITYYDALGNFKTYTENGAPVKYSQAIMNAAKDSGMSAYYLASKIVQEVGSDSAAAAGGSSGKNYPYNGIYNYYNIGANNGVSDGLRWANGYMKTSASAYLYRTASTSAERMIIIPSGTELNYIEKSGDFYRVGVTVSGTRYYGYVSASNVSMYTNYGRPWTDPYKAIYYGAKYIHTSFSDYQFTGYLQKFNVNPASGNLHLNEYMANVRAAALESSHSYSAYKSCNILSTKKVFSIPVFRNMPGEEMTADEVFAATSPTVSCASYSRSGITLSWTAVDGATGYQVFKYDVAKGEYSIVQTSSSRTYTDSGLTDGVIARYLIRAYKTGSNGTLYSSYSEKFYGACAPLAPTGLTAASVGQNSVSLKWNAVNNCTGYYVYRYDAISGVYSYVGSTTATAYTDSSVLSGTAYAYRVKAYFTTLSMTSVSEYSSAINVTTSGTTAAQIGVVKVSDWLNVRSEPSTSGTVIAELTNGYRVYILGKTGVWYKIQFTLNGKQYTGYAHSDYITVTGSAQTCPYSEPTVILQNGDSGDGVRWVQWYLCKLGYLTTADIDGSFGPTTYAAVVKFQRDKGIAADGVVGSGTRAALKTAMGY
ncbi:MAG: SH3 domain-containing protein [Clostridia bacterium]|nr:SH3 domain-containing protein [Clostridia bacterium]